MLNIPSITPIMQAKIKEITAINKVISKPDNKVGRHSINKLKYAAIIVGTPIYICPPKGAHRSLN
jgi:hypothetical protein